MIRGKRYPVEDNVRKYTFIGAYIELENVTEMIVSNSNNHKLKTADGKLHIISSDWIHIEITSDKDWIF